MTKTSSPAKGRSNTAGETRILRLAEMPGESSVGLSQWSEGSWRECALPESLRTAFHLPETGAQNDELLPPSIAEGDKVLLLLPGHWVWSGTEQIPKAARRQPQAVGYMVEERLAGDVEDLHFLCQPRSGELCTVYAVDRERMAAVSAALSGLGWSVLAVIPEYQLLDSGEEGDILWLDGEHAHLWQGQGHGISLRRQYLKPVLESLALSSNDGSSEPDGGVVSPTLKVLGKVDELFEAELRILFGDRLEFHREQPEAQLVAAAKPAQLANLLCGEFKPAEPTSERHWWALPAKVAAACFVLQLLLFVGAGTYSNWRAAAIEKEAQALFSELFPNDTPRADIRRQVEGYLRQSSAGGGTFANMLQHLSQVWAQSRSQGLRLQSLRFDGTRGDMVLQLQAKNLSDLDTVVGQLSAGPVRAELLAANELEDGVSGRIRLR